jgi:hypothetical protein
VFFGAKPAFACFDGWSAAAGPISVVQATDGEWEPKMARDFARWSARLEMVIPPGSTLHVDHGHVSIGAKEVATRWDGRDLAKLFDLVVRDQHVGNVSGAMARDRVALTVQVLAVHDRKVAEAFAEKIDDRHRAPPPDETTPPATLPSSFYEAGGYPAVHRVAHVLETKDGAEAPLFQVVVGAFLLRADADAARDVVEKSFGHRGFVRSL